MLGIKVNALKKNNSSTVTMSIRLMLEIVKLFTQGMIYKDTEMYEYQKFI